MGQWRRALTGAVVAGGLTRVASIALDRWAPGGPDRWQRTNHRGEPVSLTEGPALAAGLMGGALVGGAGGRARMGAAVATAGAGVFGLLDDLGEHGDQKGLAGHFRALAHGEVTTGALKVLGIGASSVVAAAVAGQPTGGAAARCGRTLLGGALIAGSANLANLLDLRPGRVLKASSVGAAGLLAGRRSAGLAGAALGASAAVAEADLAERSMAGDAGANALGAILGFAMTQALGVRGQAVALSGVVALTLASEKVSFTTIIDSSPILSCVDALGRRPADPNQ